MKRLVPVLALLFTSPLAAQEVETVLTEPTSHGGFGGPVMAFTSIRGVFGVMLGGRGGWIINHQFVIGGRGAALVDISPNKIGNIQSYPKTAAWNCSTSIARPRSRTSRPSS